MEKKHSFVVEKRITAFSKAYADDLCLVTAKVKGQQLALDKTNEWLNWTQTMAAKPKKCVSLAFRQFRKGAPSKQGFVAVQDTVYSAYDPKLTITGQPVNFILQHKEGVSDFKNSHFKFLGRWIHGLLDEEAVKQKFKSQFFEDLETVGNAPINGFMKIWIYQHFVLGMASWALFIHDFNHSFIADNITSPTGVILKKWAGLFKSAEVGTLYRPRPMLGLGLTSVTVLFEKLQVIKCHLIKNSPDEHVTDLYKLREKREHSETGRIWRPTVLTAYADSMVKHQLMYQQAEAGDRRGLGHGLFVPVDPPLPEHRKLCTAAVGKLQLEHLTAHSHSLPMQGVWTQWWDRTLSFDFTWNNLIYGPGPRVLSFVLNAYINSLPSPDMRKLLGYEEEGLCKLCGEPGTLHHILVNCSKALLGKRYNWRHDSVLATMLQALQPYLIAHNNSPPPASKPPPINECFVLSGSKVLTKSKPQRRPSLLGTATDWKLLVDFDKQKILFPVHIASTDKRPDVVLWSDSLRVVILAELTCPAEEGIIAASIRKKARYQPLKASIEDEARKYPWTAHVLTIEAGARGFVAKSMQSFFRKIGFTGTLARKVCKDISVVTARCSYGIWLMRNTATWNSSRQLVVPNTEDYESPPPLAILPELSYS